MEELRCMNASNQLYDEVIKAYIPTLADTGIVGDENFADDVASAFSDRYVGVVKAFTKAVAQSEVTQKNSQHGFWAKLFNNNWDETAKIIVCAESRDGVPDINFTPYPSVHLAAMRLLAAKADIDPNTVSAMGSHSRYTLGPKAYPKSWLVAGFKTAADAQAVIDFAKAEMDKVGASHRKFEQVIALANNG